MHEIEELKRQGLSVQAISNLTGYDRKTVRKYLIQQRFFGIPPFRFYALADEIRKILSHGTFGPPEMPPPSQQLELTLGWEG